MNENGKNYLSRAWRILNAVLAAVFTYLIADAWIQIFYFKNTGKHYYYIATLFLIPLLTCLIVVFDWKIEER